MPKIFVKNHIPSLRKLLSEKRGEKMVQLIDYSTLKFKEHGIVSRTYSKKIDLRFINVSTKRFFVKIFTSLISKLTKNIPFLEFLNIDVGSLSGYSFVFSLGEYYHKIPVIKLKQIGVITDTTINRSRLTRLDLSVINVKYNSFTRYVRYLNYLAIKYKSPLKIRFIPEVTMLLNDKPLMDSDISDDKLITINVVFRIGIEAGSWICRTDSLSSSIVSVMDYEFSSFDTQQDSYSTFPEYSIFNIVLHLSHISMSLRTLLTRGKFNENAYATGNT